MIVNSGTGPISALQPQHLSVQTLPGSSTTVTLRLNVQATVRKIKLTEQGSLQSGSTGPYQFSSAQVVFP